MALKADYEKAAKTKKYYYEFDVCIMPVLCFVNLLKLYNSGV